MDLPLRWNGSWRPAILDEYDAASAFSLGPRENDCSGPHKLSLNEKAWKDALRELGGW